MATDREPAPSRTAMLVAVGRAVHLFAHGPGALPQDWLAWPFLGPEADGVLAMARGLAGDAMPVFADWFAGRTRICEDWLAASGAEQHVILGAGLDSPAWRHPGRARVFELDHPDTQNFKRGRVARLGLPEPVGLEWVPIDFARDDLAARLAVAGLDRSRATFVTCVGLSYYLDESTLDATLEALGPCQLAMSYALPAHCWPAGVAERLPAILDRFAAMGEPWVTMLESQQAAALLRGHGFKVARTPAPTTSRATTDSLRATLSALCWPGETARRASSAPYEKRSTPTDQSDRYLSPSPE